MKDLRENNCVQKKKSLICLFCRGTVKLEKIENHIQNDHDVHFDCDLILDLVKLGSETLKDVIKNHKKIVNISTNQQHVRSNFGENNSIETENIRDSKIIYRQEINRRQKTFVIQRDIDKLDTQLTNKEVFNNDSTYLEETVNKNIDNVTNIIEETISDKTRDKPIKIELEKGDWEKKIDNDTNLIEETVIDSDKARNIVAPINRELKKVIIKNESIDGRKKLKGRKNNSVSKILDSKFACKLCDKSYTSIQPLSNHGKKIHPQHLDLFPPVPSAPLRGLHSRITKDGQNGKEFECAISSCKFTFDTFQGLMTHERRCHKEDFICAFCGLVSQGLKLLIEHYDNDHVDTAMYACRICGVFNFSLRDFNKHNRDKHEEGELKLIKCKYCEYKTEKRYEIAIHKNRSHNEGKKFYCAQCGKDFANNITLQYHNKNSHSDGKNIKMINCDYCPKQFNPNNFRKHIVTHTKKMSVYCEFCGKGCHNKSQLKKHEIIKHTDENAFLYYCDTCGKGFKRKHSYRDHCKLHLNQRDKICGLCGSSYVSTKGLNKHTKSVHSAALESK